MAAKKEPAVQSAAVSDKKKALETAMQQIEKMYGKGSIMRYDIILCSHYLIIVLFKNTLPHIFYSFSGMKLLYHISFRKAST